MDPSGPSERECLRCHPARTRPEFGSLMRLLVLTASKALPGTRRRVCSTSLANSASECRIGEIDVIVLSYRYIVGCV